MMDMHDKINSLILKYGTKTVDKVIMDLEASKHTSRFLKEVKKRQIIPDGDSCVACVMSNWKYSLGAVYKIEIGAYYILSKAVEELLSEGILSNEKLVKESFDEITRRIIKLRF
jgi:hypothetical protein